MDNHMNELVAVKVIDLEEAQDDLATIHEEITLLSACDSPQIVK